MSLRRRVLLGIVVVAFVLVGTNVVLAANYRSVLLDRVDAQLVDAAGRPQLRDGGPGGRPRFRDENLSEYVIGMINNADDGLTIIPSAFADEKPMPKLTAEKVRAKAGLSPRTAKPFTVGSVEGSGRWRVIAVGRPGPQGSVAMLALSLDDMQATLNRTRAVQAAGTLAVLAALGLVLWWVLRLGVHPIEDMAATADAIAEGDLSSRVAHPGPETEAGRLGIAINSMLGRIEEAFRAREASEARVRRFAADASHELRTPLTSIQGYAELWRTGALKGKEKQNDAMRRIEQEAQRMSALVEDLLVLARLDQGRPLERTPVRLDQIVDDAVRDARAVEPDRPVALDAHEPVVVQGDDNRLRQVVSNLLANARDHTPPGTPVRVSVRRENGVARIEVADDGPGMSSDVAAQVFERFYRADSSRVRAAGGTGLGLSIVAAVAEAHGGKATVESAVGRGSCFVVEVPAS